jgi:hypothetical protein
MVGSVSGDIKEALSSADCACMYMYVCMYVCTCISGQVRGGMHPVKGRRVGQKEAGVKGSSQGLALCCRPGPGDWAQEEVPLTQA